MKFVDLHTHSKASDGSMSPSELIVHAKASGLSAVALTDHDTVAGVPEAAQKARECGIEFIPGVEFSAWYIDREIHIVGLFIDIRQKTFLQKAESVAGEREKRNLRMIEKMQAAGIDITIESLKACEGDGILTRANFAGWLLKHGIVKTYQEAFDKYLDKGKPFYVPRTRLTPEAAIAQIKAAGGIPVLAHPLLYKFTEDGLGGCIAKLIPMGLMAIEAYYSKNMGFDEIRVKNIAARYHLLLSGGSDFHGSYKPDTKIAFPAIPYEVLAALKTAAGKAP